jgi:hypothetical protein
MPSTHLGRKLCLSASRFGFCYARSEQKLKVLARDAKGKARAGTPREAAQEADAVLLAVQRPTRQRISRGADPRRGFQSGGRWTAADRPIHRAVRAARRPARVRGKRGPGTGLPVRVA